jgi:hypothetical protein
MNEINMMEYGSYIVEEKSKNSHNKETKNQAAIARLRKTSFVYKVFYLCGFRMP